jgi:NAD(P)-dependent dehydrogenase (short-subunit alcohol dehydrogenase family)
VSNLKNYLIFGATGAIGSACHRRLEASESVISGSRDINSLHAQLESIQEISGVIWAQGQNTSDSIVDLDVDKLEAIFKANLTFILETSKELLVLNKLQRGANLVVISSIWGGMAKPSKLSYTISKSAVSGLVRSLAVDLGPMGICVNSISPGPINTAMTIANLSKTEIGRIASETPLKRLVNLEEVAQVACNFAQGKMAGVTGQDLVIDGGWGVSKLV